MEFLSAYYVGLDLGKRQDFTALAVIEEPLWVPNEQTLWQWNLVGIGTVGAVRGWHRKEVFPMQYQSSTARTITAKDGYTVPATVDQTTDLNDLPICEMLYHRDNGGKVSRATLSLVMDGMRDAAAVVTLYIGADGGQDARVL